LPLRTNVFPFKLPEDLTLYRYDVTVMLRDGKFTKDLTKGAGDE